MRKKLGPTPLILLAVAAIAFVFMMGAGAAVGARHPGNVMPLGWEYEPGYAVWRAERGLATTPQTWRKYARERKPLTRGETRRLDRQFFSALDRTVGELADLFVR